MALVSNLKNRIDNVLAHAYGTHAVGGSNLIQHIVNTSGSTKQITLRAALGDSANPYGWSAIRSIRYDGFEIDAVDYHFHRGTLSTGTNDPVQGVDSFIADGQTYNQTPHVVLRLPSGVAVDAGDPDKVQIIVDCQLVMDYDAAGNEAGVVFSANPALLAANEILEVKGLPKSFIDWAWWYAWRNYNAFSLSVTDSAGVTTEIPRFESHPVFNSQLSLEDRLDQICYACCADWHFVNGKIRFLTPEPATAMGALQIAGRRAVVHHFVDDADGTRAPGTGNIVQGTLNAYEIDTRDLWTELKGKFRDLDTPVLSEADVTAKRGDIYAEVEGDQKGEQYLGPMRRNQAWRITQFQMRRRVDRRQRCELRGMGDSMHVLPGDVVKVSTSLYNWTEKLFLVIEVEDNPEGGADEREFVLHEYDANDYRDHDTETGQTVVVPDAPSPVAPPPHISSATVTPSGVLHDDGTFTASILVTVNFAAHVGAQVGRVYLERVNSGQSARVAAEITPTVTGQGVTEIKNIAPGDYIVRVNTASLAGAARPLSETVAYPVSVAARAVAPAVPGTMSASTIVDRGVIRLNWIRSASNEVRAYRVVELVGGAEVTIHAALDALTVDVPIVRAVNTWRIYALTAAGVPSGTYSELANYAVPSPLVPDGFTLTYDGAAHRLRERLTAIPGTTYDYASANDGTGILASNVADGINDETNFPTTSRSITRYARARRFNITSGWTSAQVTIDAPGAPALTRNAALSLNTSVVFNVTPHASTIQANVRRTHLQVASDPGFATVLATYAIAGASGVFLVGGDVAKTPTVYVRSYQEDAFGISAYSGTETYTFTTFNDGFFDPSSNLVRLSSSLMPLMSGGGSLAFSAAGAFSWTDAFVIGPLSTNISPTGKLEIPAASWALGIGQVLVARASVGSSSVTVSAYTASSYQPPAATTGQFDVPLAHRFISGELKIYDGHILAPGQTVRAGTFIPDASIINAYIADATIKSAKIESLTADKIVASVLQAYLIFATAMGSTNYVANNLGWYLHPDGSGEFNGGIKIKGTPLTEIELRLINAIDATNRYRGNDTDVIPRTAVPSGRYNLINTQYLFEDDWVEPQIYLNLDGLLIDDATCNGDTARWVLMAVLDKFGRPLQFTRGGYMYHTWTGRGLVSKVSHERKYADPASEATYRVQMRNRHGYSQELYMHQNTRLAAPPTFRLLHLTPQELDATPLSDTVTQLTFTYPGSSTLYLERRTIGKAFQFGAWATVVTGIAANATSVRDPTCNPYTRYEWRLNDGNGNTSNIAYARTYQPSFAPPARPAPASLNATAVSPTSLVWTWQRVATDNTGVEYSLDGGAWTALASADTETVTTTVAAGSTHTLRVRNKWSSGVTYSPETDKTATTPAAAQSSLAPSGLRTTSVGRYSIAYAWTNPATTFYWRADGAGAYTAIPFGSNVTTHNLTGLSPDTFYEVYVANASGQTEPLLTPTLPFPVEEDYRQPL